MLFEMKNHIKLKSKPHMEMAGFNTMKFILLAKKCIRSKMIMLEKIRFDCKLGNKVAKECVVKCV